jgi:hypothetical protein
MDSTNEIIRDWYELLQDNHVGVQPKAATMLKQILDRYDIKARKRDVWNEFMSVKAGNFDTWYRSLTSDQQAEFEVKRCKSREQSSTGFYNGNQLLKD